MTGLIQGKDAVLSLYKNDWVPFVCATDITLTLTSEELPVRTVKDGHFKKVTYQNLSYTVNLSGILKFDDDDHWSGWDMMENQLGFNDVNFRITFTDQENANVRSVQGFAIVTTSTVGISAGAVVKGDFDLKGNGALFLFDGSVPCDAEITSISITGQAASDGIAHVTYTATGDPYQVKYRVDGNGDYITVLTAAPIAIEGLSVGAHVIEVIPICQNAYEGDGMQQVFTMTQTMTCTSGVTGINQTATTLFPLLTGDPAYYDYKFETGGTIRMPAHQGININVLQPGAHTVTITPICANNVPGTGGTFSFTKTSTPGIARLAYAFTNAAGAAGGLKVYVNGVLTISSASGSGTIFIQPGQVIRAVLTATALSGTGRHMDLLSEDTTAATTLNHQTGSSPATLTYTFTQTGGNKKITGTIT
jgi:hypothetical protein